MALVYPLLGLLGYALGNLIFSWSMASNPYFSGVVRIQEERGHTVAMGGPYRIVRHPGYVGYILFTLSTPLALGSLWGFVPAVLASLGMVVRTGLEDRTLREELAGYKDYARRVRYRLLPGVW
jgi:protein-S-isoprenylcysteine O-methyltransferase Ste14